MSRRIVGAAGLGLAALLAFGCSSSSSSTTAGPAGPASLQIDGLQPSGGPRAARGDACVELGRDAVQTIGVEVTAGNWTLRPPGACGATPQCGTVTLTMDPSSATPFVVRSATDFVPMPMASLASPLGTHVFHVALTNDDGTVFVDSKTKQSLEDEISVQVTAPGDCGGKPFDAGTDAGDAASGAGDAASDAGDAASDAGDAASDAGDAASDAGDAASDASAGDSGADATPDATTDASDAAATDASDAASDATTDSPAG